MNGSLTTDPPQLVALFNRRPQVIKPGLDRVKAAIEALGQPELLARPTVLVGGTNGKGTTSGFLWQLCAAERWRVGLFSSPHLLNFRERIQVSDRMVSDQDLIEELARLEAEIPPTVFEALSFFEINTVLALRIFARANTDLNILEVGMGGRWDSTNISDPCISVITSIGLDHQQWLGSTHAAIAGEKAGIMRARRPVIWGGHRAGTEDAATVLRDTAASLHAPFWEQGKEFDLVGDSIELKLPDCPATSISLPQKASRWPPFLRQNYANALAVFYWLLTTAKVRAPKSTPSQSLEVATKAIDAGAVPTPACMRARFDLLELQVPALGRKRSLLLDVCHNTAGAKALVEGLKATGLSTPAAPKLPALVSILVDKDCDEILDVLREVLSPIVLFATSGERSWTADRVATRHRDLIFAPDFSAALKHLPPTDKTTVICGSVHAVGEVMRDFKIATT